MDRTKSRQLRKTTQLLLQICSFSSAAEMRKQALEEIKKRVTPRERRSLRLKRKKDQQQQIEKRRQLKKKSLKEKDKERGGNPHRPKSRRLQGLEIIADKENQERAQQAPVPDHVHCHEKNKATVARTNVNETPCLGPDTYAGRSDVCLGPDTSASRSDVSLSPCLGPDTSAARSDERLSPCLGPDTSAARSDVSLSPCLKPDTSAARSDVSLSACLKPDTSATRSDVSLSPCLKPDTSAARSDVSLNPCLKPASSDVSLSPWLKPDTSAARSDVTLSPWLKPDTAAARSDVSLSPWLKPDTAAARGDVNLSPCLETKTSASRSDVTQMMAGLSHDHQYQQQRFPSHSSSSRCDHSLQKLIENCDVDEIFLELSKRDAKIMLQELLSVRCVLPENTFIDIQEDRDISVTQLVPYDRSCRNYLAYVCSHPARGIFTMAGSTDTRLTTCVGATSSLHDAWIFRRCCKTVDEKDDFDYNHPAGISGEDILNDMMEQINDSKDVVERESISSDTKSPDDRVCEGDDFAVDSQKEVGDDVNDLEVSDQLTHSSKICDSSTLSPCFSCSKRKQERCQSEKSGKRLKMADHYSSTLEDGRLLESELGMAISTALSPCHETVAPPNPTPPPSVLGDDSTNSDDDTVAPPNPTPPPSVLGDDSTNSDDDTVASPNPTPPPSVLGNDSTHSDDDTVAPPNPTPPPSVLGNDSTNSDDDTVASRNDSEDSEGSSEGEKDDVDEEINMKDELFFDFIPQRFHNEVVVHNIKYRVDQLMKSQYSRKGVSHSPITAQIDRGV